MEPFFKDCLVKFISNLIQLNPTIKCNELNWLKMYIQYIASSSDITYLLENTLANKDKIKNHQLDFFLTLDEFKIFVCKFISTERFNYLVENLWTNITNAERQAIYGWAEKLIAVIEGEVKNDFFVKI